MGTEENPDDVAEFYQVYKDQFVSEYSSTNVVEDIAETFTHLVLRKKPEIDDESSIADQKIDFLYDYDDMVQLRTIIRGKVNRL